jgi:transposase
MKNMVTRSRKEVLPVITGEEFMDIKAMNRDGLSIRRIAKITGLHRKTVKRHLESTSLPEYHRTKRKGSILDPFRPMIDAYLEEDDYQGSWIFDKLVNMGYKGGYTVVKDAVRTIKGEKTRVAYIRLETEPAFQAQVDWGDFQIEGAGPMGAIHTVYVFVMVLGYSRAMYVDDENTADDEAYRGKCRDDLFCKTEDIFADSTHFSLLREKRVLRPYLVCVRKPPVLKQRQHPLSG